MSDDLRAAVPRFVSVATYVLLMFSFPAQRWFVVVRSDRRKEFLEDVGRNLHAITQQPCRVISLSCDPDDIDAIERAALRERAPVENAQMSAHFDHYLKPPKGL